MLWSFNGHPSLRGTQWAVRAEEWDSSMLRPRMPPGPFISQGAAAYPDELNEILANKIVKQAREYKRAKLNLPPPQDGSTIATTAKGTERPKVILKPRQQNMVPSIHGWTPEKGKGVTYAEGSRECDNPLGVGLLSSPRSEPWEGLKESCGEAPATPPTKPPPKVETSPSSLLSTDDSSSAGEVC